MRVHQKKFILSSLLSLGLFLQSEGISYAAQPINLHQQDVSILPALFTSSALNIKEISRALDFNQTLHVRIKETYSGYPVWGADAVIHIPQGMNTGNSLTEVFTAASHHHGSMNGTVYQQLSADLSNSPSTVFREMQEKKIMQQVMDQYQRKMGGLWILTDQESEPMIFITKNNQAHWTYRMHFSARPMQSSVIPSKPNYIVDALSSKIYAEWDDIQTAVPAEPSMRVVKAFGGGFGGNQKMGQVTYDGLAKHLPKLNIKRDTTKKICYLKNADVTVKNYNDKKIIHFICEATDNQHNKVYWDGDHDAVNGGYSPSNDALFGGAVIKEMYMKWYGVPVLEQNGKPMILTMVVHMPVDNAYWNGKQMVFGDGINIFYPLTSLGVAAHEISHGFTEQHSNLIYDGQSGGMNEAYSDMAAQGAEFYATGKNSWQIGPEIFKANNQALRYMDKPSKDCKGKKPGNWCSIDVLDQYYDGLDVHFSSGIYNHFFYLLGTASDWNTKKAFDVMEKANANYWTADSSFVEGACGVIKAAQDYKYDVSAVKKAFDEVHIDTKSC